MTPGKKHLGGGKQRSRQPHHISSVVHHFLDAPDEPAPPVTVHRTIHVCGSGPAHLIAWVCAGLVRGCGLAGVVLAESGRLDWSATSHFPPSDLQGWPDATAKPTAARDLDCWVWTGSGERPPASPLVETVFRNLGSLNNHHLVRLEAASLVPGTGQNESNPAETLVWCLTPQESVFLSSAYTLGRALSLLNPSSLEIVVADEGCLHPHRTQPTLVATSALGRCRQTLDPVVGSLATRYHLVSPVKSGKHLNPGAILAALGALLVGGDDSD